MKGPAPTVVRLGVAAVTAGLDVREVPPQLTAQARRRGRTQTKTDQVDALVIARIALRDHTLAAPTYWEDTEDLRCWSHTAVNW